MLLYVHVLFAAIWLGTAATLPFWGNRMNRADHLNTVLDIIDTVFILKCAFIMTGLMVTLITGTIMMINMGYSLNPLQNPHWIMISQLISALIFLNSWIIFFFIYWGRKGRRTLMRLVPPIGYTNIGLIAFVMLLMVTKPGDDKASSLAWTAISLISAANLINIALKMRRAYRIRQMQPPQFVDLYFSLLNEEKMTDLFKLFDDRTVFNDPFATGPVKGILALEQFFQKLGDQFETIKISPKSVSGTREKIFINWEAAGVTTNGAKMESLRGTNTMTRRKGKIIKVDINFNTSDLPPVQLVAV